MSGVVDLYTIAGIPPQASVANIFPLIWYDSNYISLYEAGCHINGTGGLRDCTKACQNPETLWGDVYTLTNCFAYSTISILLSQDKLTDNGKSIADDFNILPGQDHISNITTQINWCAGDYYSNEGYDDSMAWAYEWLVQPPTLNWTVDNLIVGNYDSIAWYAEICEHTSWDTNADIGGIGVYISYLMQIALVLSAWLYSSFLTTWARPITYAIYRRYGDATASERADDVQHKLNKTAQYPALISGLVEYQKAQTYFAITLHGAAVFAMQGTGKIFDATTYIQIDLTVALMGEVATASIICITLGLYLLHKAEKTSWYVTILSLLASTISLTAWTITRKSLDNLDPQDEPEVKLQNCGGYHTPVKYCTASTTIHYETKFEAPMIACCMAVLLFLVVKQGGHQLAKWYSKHHLSSRLWTAKSDKIEQPKTIKLTSPQFSLQEKAIKVLRIAVEASLVIAALIMLVWLINPKSLGSKWYSASESGLQCSDWTFGQLIAITIWAPSIIEYVHSALYGVKHAHEHRYPRPFKLVKDDSPDDIPTIVRQGTFYTRLDSHSDLELPLAHHHSARSSFQEP